MKKAILASVFSMVCAFQASAAVVLIGHPSAAELDKGTVNKMYLGKTTRVGGNKVVLNELAEGHALRSEFHGKVTGRNDSQLQSNWSRLVFTGKAEAPTVQADEAAMIAAVKANPNTYGYIDEANVTAEVKVVFKP